MTKDFWLGLLTMACIMVISVMTYHVLNPLHGATLKLKLKPKQTLTIKSVQSVQSKE